MCQSLFLFCTSVGILFCIAYLKDSAVTLRPEQQRHANHNNYPNSRHGEKLKNRI